MFGLSTPLQAPIASVQKLLSSYTSVLHEYVNLGNLELDAFLWPTKSQVPMVMRFLSKPKKT